MAVTSDWITVGTSPTLLHTATGATRVYLHPESAPAARIGGAGVTWTTGAPLFGMNNINPSYFELTDGASIYGVVDSGTTIVSVLAIN